jgi:serine/alanine adding enzyme
MIIKHELDTDQWLKFVKNNNRANIFHTPYMMEIFNSTKNYKPILVAYVDENTNEILSLTILVQITLYNGLLARFTSRTVSYGGIIHTEDASGIASVKSLLKEYDQIYKKQVLYTEIRNISSTNMIRENLEQVGYNFSDFVNYIIELKRPRDELFNSFSKSLRRNIRKSMKNGFCIERIKDISQIAVLYDLLQKSYSRGKVPLPDISLFESTFKVLYKRNLLNIFLLKHENTYVAGRVILSSKKTLFDWYAGSNPEYNKLYPNEYLIWYIMRCARRTGYTKFDFGGAGVPDEKYGVRDFKSRFNGDLVNYGRYTKINQKTILSISKFFYSIRKRFV